VLYFHELFDNQKQEEIKVKEGVQFQKTLKDKLDLDLRELSDIKKTERAWRGIIENLLMEKLQLFSNAKFYTPFFLSAENSHRDMWLVHLSNHSQWQRVMDVNLNGLFNVTQKLMLPMMKTRWGRIINLSSVAGYQNKR
jgi:NAD(P)-dependent dehydrogenase (short-subunit alcohol dehydrogenase family)